MEYAGKKNIELSVNDAYTSIEELPLYNFDMYRRTHDFNWLVRGYTGKETKLPTQQLQPVADKIIEEYYNDIEDNSFIRTMQRFAKIDALVLKYNTVLSLVNRMMLGFDATPSSQEMRYNFIQELKKWSYSIPFQAQPLEDIQNLNKVLERLQSIKTNIGLLQQENQQKEAKNSISLQKQLAIVALGLGLNYRLDPKQITVKEWNEYNKLLAEKAKQN